MSHADASAALSSAGDVIPSFGNTRYRCVLIVRCDRYRRRPISRFDEPRRRQLRDLQLLGAANIEGSPLFHVISGNLGYQVEHHLYPDMPSTRYGEIAPRVRAICEKYELPYNTGPLFKQLGTVQRTILRLAFPGGKPRPKPGPYRGEPAGDAEPELAAAAQV